MEAGWDVMSVSQPILSDRPAKIGISSHGALATPVPSAVEKKAQFGLVNRMCSAAPVDYLNSSTAVTRGRHTLAYWAACSFSL